MNINETINTLVALGEKLNQPNNIPNELLKRAYNTNNWFTGKYVLQAIASVANMLDKSKLSKWVEKYPINENSSNKNVGIIMAGNIPLVGFSDLLAVLITGHIAKIKLSSQDNVLLPFVIEQLLSINPFLSKSIKIIPQITDIDAVILTGSDNTARYFDYYYGKYPHIIRKNRSSCAVLTGEELPEEIHRLGKDIFTYYGLGCRNVSKIYAPEGFDMNVVIRNLTDYKNAIDHHKYRNNYNYNKSIFTVNREPHLDNGFLLMTENKAIVSPIAVLYYEHYKNHSHLEELIDLQRNKIQCIVSRGGVYKDGVPFGQSQHPSLMDYADNIDVMEFLCALQ